jgi:hypothetical protein
MIIKYLKLSCRSKLITAFISRQKPGHWSQSPRGRVAPVWMRAMNRKEHGCRGQSGDDSQGWLVVLQGLQLVIHLLGPVNVIQAAQKQEGVS